MGKSKGNRKRKESKRKTETETEMETETETETETEMESKSKSKSKSKIKSGSKSKSEGISRQKGEGGRVAVRESGRVTGRERGRGQRICLGAEERIPKLSKSKQVLGFLKKGCKNVCVWDWIKYSSMLEVIWGQGKERIQSFNSIRFSTTGGSRALLVPDLPAVCSEIRLENEQA